LLEQSKLLDLSRKALIGSCRRAGGRSPAGQRPKPRERNLTGSRPGHHTNVARCNAEIEPPGNAARRGATAWRDPRLAIVSVLKTPYAEGEHLWPVYELTEEEE